MIYLYTNTNRAEVSQKPLDVPLTAMECKIVETLIRNWDIVTTFEELFRVIWDGTTEDNYYDALNVHISRLRKKGIKIKKIPQKGYILDKEMMITY